MLPSHDILFAAKNSVIQLIQTKDTYKLLSIQQGASLPELEASPCSAADVTMHVHFCAARHNVNVRRVTFACAMHG